MIRDFVRGCWRVVNGVRQIHPSALPCLPRAMYMFARDWASFRRLGGQAAFTDLAPKLFDHSSASQSGGGHYFYQDVWALRKLRRFQPKEHHDFGSRLDGFVAQATSICPIFYWDIRVPDFDLPDLHFRKGNIVDLPLPARSLHSLSCLHVAEHVGLGRYGDPIDPNGTERALEELERILAPGGQLLFSIPIGRERVEFNAQRIFNPEKPISTLKTLQLAEFTAIDDDGRFRHSVRPSDFCNSKYACGLYCFLKN
jgi:hypothetical protein